jgi:predicted transcriptional regulator
MLLPCEVAVKSLIPAIRSAIARELIHSYGMKQKEVANLLGVTQTAISKYTRNVRGIVFRVEDVEEIKPRLQHIVTSLANGDASKYELPKMVCGVCEALRRRRVMCKLCEYTDPTVEPQECFICNRDTHFL